MCFYCEVPPTTFNVGMGASGLRLLILFMSCPKRNTSGKSVGQSVAFFRGPALGPTCRLREALRLLEQCRCDKLGTFLTFVASILRRLFYGQAYAAAVFFVLLDKLC